MAKKISSSDIAEDDVFGKIKKSAEDTIVIIDKLSKSLTETAEAVKKSVGGAKFDSTKAIDNFVKATKQANDLQKQAIKLDQERAKASELRSKAMSAQQKRMQEVERTEQQRKRTTQESLKIEAEKERLAQQRIRTAEQQAKADERAANAVEREKNALKNTAPAYKELSDKSRALKNQSKELAAQMIKLETEGKKNSKEYRDLARSYKDVTAKAQVMDKQLKRIDSTVGDNFRNVGNYKSALSGLRSGLAAFGVGFGVSQIKGFITETIELSRIQEKAVAQVNAGLTSTGGVVGYTLDELKAKASAFQGETLFGDEQILTDLTSVMLTFTNVTGEAFDRAQQAALDLSTRMGGDLKGAAVQLGKALNDPVKGVTALQRVGVSFTEQQKEQIGALVESGKLYEAQTIVLDEMNKEFGGSAKAAADADGGVTQLSNAIGDAKEMIGAMLLEGLKPTIQGLKEFFSTLTTEDIQKFVATIGTILSILGRLAAAWAGYKTLQLSLMAIEKARAFSFADFGKKLAAQIPLTKAYRLEQLKLARSARDSGQAVSTAGKAMGAVPWMAIIAVVVELAMALYDVASGAAEARRQQDLLNAANEAAEKNLAAASDRYRKDFDEKMKALDLEIRTRKTNGESEKKLDAEKIKREKEITQGVIDRIKREQKVKNDALAETLKMEDYIRKQAAEAGRARAVTPESAAAFKEYSKFLRTTGLDKRIDDMTAYSEVLQLVVARSNRLTTEVVGLSNEAKQYGDTLKELNVEQKENDYSVKKTIHTGKTHKETIKEVNTELQQQIDLVKELNDVNADLLQGENEINQYLMDRKAQGLEEQYDDELEKQIEHTKKTGEIDKAALETLIDERAELLRAAAREQAAFDIAQLRRQHELRMFEIRSQLEEEYRTKLAQEGITEEQKAKLKAQYDQQGREIDAMELEYEKVLNQKILEINLKTQGELDDIDKDALEKKKDTNEELLDAQKEYKDKQKEAEKTGNKGIEEAAKEHLERMKALADLLTDYLTKKSDERIALLDKEISAAEDQRDFLQDLAAEGNIQASESLAEQNRIIAEANLQKEREERRKQKIALANSVYQTYASKVEADSKSPLSETIRDISLLNQFISTFTPTFKDGTEDTGKHGLGVDGQGGFHAILHPNERVLTKEQNQMVGDLSNTELANLAASYQAGTIINREGATQLGNGWNTQAVIKQLESLERTIKNKPEHKLEVENVVQGAMDIVRSTRTGGTTIYNRYRVRK